MGKTDGRRCDNNTSIDSQLYISVNLHIYYKRLYTQNCKDHKNFMTRNARHRNSYHSYS